MKEGLVSIIIPTFNRADLIAETLNSILVQTYSNWECIIVDDGSTDNTNEVVNQYLQKDSRFSYYKRPDSKLKGANACRNYGLTISKGQYVNWYDSDDLMHADKLKIQVEALSNSNNPFCVCKSYVFERNVDNVIELKSKKVNSSNPFDDFIRKEIIIPIHAPVFKKQFFLREKYTFNESLQAGQEWEFFAKVLFKNSNYDVVDAPLDYIRRHEKSISSIKASEHQLWFYFLARVSVFDKLKTDLKNENILFFKRYFLMSYKLFLREGYFSKALKVWKMMIASDKTYSIKQQTYLILSLISFKFFGKGDMFLARVNRWNDEK